MVNFDPTPEQRRFIEANVRSGRFRDPGAVLRESLELMMALEAAERGRYEVWLAEARQKIEEGWQAAERGEVVDGEEAFRRLDDRIAEHERREIESREQP